MALKTHSSVFTHPDDEDQKTFFSKSHVYKYTLIMTTVWYYWCWICGVTYHDA